MSVVKESTLGSGLRAIQEYAFNGCSALEEITIPSTVRAIYPYAFEGCVSLRYLKFDGVEDTMTECSNPSCGVTICPASKELGFTTHYHSTYWFASEQAGSAFGHYHWIFSHDITDPNEAWKYFVADENGDFQAGVIHNHALGGQGAHWSYSEDLGKYLFNGLEEFYGGEYNSYNGTNAHEDIISWYWMDTSSQYWFNGIKGEY